MPASEPVVITSIASFGQVVDAIDDRVLRLSVWDPFVRSILLLLSLPACLVLVPVAASHFPALLGQLERSSGAWEFFRALRAVAFHATLAVLPLAVMVISLGAPKIPAVCVCRANRKVYGPANWLGFGRWVEMDFDTITAVAFANSGEGGFVHTLRLYETERDTDRIVKRIYMPCAPTPDGPRRTWEFVRAYMHQPPHRVPGVVLASPGTGSADGVHVSNGRFLSFSGLVDSRTGRIETPLRQAMAVVMGAVVYIYFIGNWIIDWVAPVRRAPAGLRASLARPAARPSQYFQRSAGNPTRIQGVAGPESWIHLLGIVFSLAIYVAICRWMWNLSKYVFYAG